MPAKRESDPPECNRIYRYWVGLRELRDGSARDLPSIRRIANQLRQKDPDEIYEHTMRRIHSYEFWHRFRGMKLARIRIFLPNSYGTNIRPVENIIVKHHVT